MLRRARLDQPFDKLGLIFVRRGIRPVTALANVANRHGHIERIGERHILPAIVRGGHAYVVGDLLLEDAIAIFGSEAQERYRGAQGLGHRKDAVPHMPAVRVGARARVATLRVYDTVNDKSAHANIVQDSTAVERVERGAWCCDGHSGPWLDGNLRPLLALELRAQPCFVRDRGTCICHRYLAPVVIACPCHGLLGDLRPQIRDTRVVEHECRKPVERAVVHRVYNREREGRS